MSITRYTCGGGRIPPYEWPDGEYVLHSDHEAALAAAVAKEREECAALCDRFAQREMHPAECAAAIRARGDK